MMLEMAQEVKIDLNAKDDEETTGFIWACYKKHSEVINLLLAQAESLQIDLQAKDDEGKSGFDRFPEHFISKNRLKKNKFKNSNFSNCKSKYTKNKS